MAVAAVGLVFVAVSFQFLSKISGVFQICLNSGNTSWCQNYLNCCSNKKKHTFTPNVL